METKKTIERGGEISILRDGKVFEKVGVNISTVFGSFDKKFSKQIPGTSKSRKFWASGISVVIHPKNPNIPSLHFNTIGILRLEKNGLVVVLT